MQALQPCVSVYSETRMRTVCQQEDSSAGVRYSHATTEPIQVVVWLLTLNYAGERQRIEFGDLK